MYDAERAPSRLAGCGFVTYNSEESARSAIDALSDTCVLGQNGKPLVVKFAEGLRQRMEHKLYVANLPVEMEEEEAHALFAQVTRPSESSPQLLAATADVRTFVLVSPPCCLPGGLPPPPHTLP